MNDKLSRENFNQHKSEKLLDAFLFHAEKREAQKLQKELEFLKKRNEFIMHAKKRKVEDSGTDKKPATAEAAQSTKSASAAVPEESKGDVPAASKVEEEKKTESAKLATEQQQSKSKCNKNIY